MDEERDRHMEHNPSKTPEPPPAQSTPAAREKQENPMTGTRTEASGDGEHTRRAARRRRPTSAEAAAARKRAVGVAAAVVSVVTTIVVVVLAVHIVFVVFEANTANDLVGWIGDRATDAAWQFKDVFQPEDRKAAVVVNYGLAAVVYLIAGRILTRLIRRLA